jgi:hypothetical protein
VVRNETITNVYVTEYCSDSLTFKDIQCNTRGRKDQRQRQCRRTNRLGTSQLHLLYFDDVIYSYNIIIISYP